MSIEFKISASALLCVAMGEEFGRGLPRGRPKTGEAPVLSEVSNDNRCDQAYSSVAERRYYMADVGGSIPSAPTMLNLS